MRPKNPLVCHESPKPEPLEIEMVAELVAQRVEERSEGRDFLPHRRTHPQSNQHAFGIVVPEQFGHPVFSDFQGSGCEHPDGEGRGFVECRCFCQELGASTAYVVFPACMADSMDFAIAGRRPFCGSSSTLSRSLSRNPARSVLRGGVAVSIALAVLTRLNSYPAFGRWRFAV